MSEEYGEDQPWHLTQEPNAEPSYEELIDRIEELEAEVKKQALQYLCDAGQLGERVGELISVLEEVDAWVEGLGYYADESAELVPVFKKVKAVLGKGYK